MYIQKLLNKEGISVIGFGSDGDPRSLKAQKSLQNFGNDYEFCGFPLAASLHNDIMSTQDSLHLLKKLKASLYDHCDLLRMGNFYATLGHLVIIFKNFDKNRHNLRVSDIDPSDLMNYSVLDKILTDNIQDLLRTVKNSDATIIFLEIMQGIKKAYVQEDVAVKDRLFCASWTLHLVRLWKTSLIKNKIPMKHFISSNSYECLELNYVFLIKLIISNKGDSIHFLNSQIVEGFFRKLRSYSGVEDLVVGSSMKGVLTRIQKIQIEEKLVYDMNHKYDFPKQQKKNVQRSDFHSTITNEEVIETLKLAVSFAERRANLLGIEVEPIDMKLLTKAENTQESFVCDLRNNIEMDFLTKDYLVIENDRLNELNIDNDQDIDTEASQLLNDITIQGIHFEKNRSTTNSQLTGIYNGKQIMITKNRLCCLLQNNRIKVSGDITRRFITKRDILIRPAQEKEMIWKEEKIGRGDHIIIHESDMLIIGRVINMQYSKEKGKKNRKYPGDFVSVESSKAKGLNVLLDPSYYFDNENIVELHEKEFYSVSNYVCHTIGPEHFSTSEYVEQLLKYINDK